MEQEHHLIGSIYDAALDKSLWPGVMAGLAATCDADTAGIAGIDSLNPDYNLFYYHGFSNELLMEMFQEQLHLAQYEFMGRQWMDHLAEGEPSSSDEFFGSMEAYQAAGGRYVEFINRHGLYHQAPVVLERTEFRRTGLGLNNGRGKPFHRDQLALLARLAPHLRRALQIHRQLTYTAQPGHQLHAILGTLPVGVLLLDTQARVVFANAQAESCLSLTQVLHVCPGGQITAAEPGQRKELGRLLRGAIDTRHGQPGNAGGVIGLASMHRRAPVMLSVLPLSATGLASGSVAAAVFLTDPEQPQQLSARLLRDSYQLSPREIDICQRFVNQPTLVLIADQSGLTQESLRSVLKTIYEKTGRHSQAELMQLLKGLCVNFLHIP